MCFWEVQTKTLNNHPVLFFFLVHVLCSNCSPNQQDPPVAGCSDVSSGEQRSVKGVNVALSFLLGHYLETVDAVLLYSFQGLFFFLTCSTFCHRPRHRTLSSGCTVTGSHPSQGSSPASQVNTTAGSDPHSSCTAGQSRHTYRAIQKRERFLGLSHDRGRVHVGQ